MDRKGCPFHCSAQVFVVGVGWNFVFYGMARGSELWDYLPHHQHKPSIGVRYSGVGMCVCVCDLHLRHAEVMPGCMWN